MPTNAIKKQLHLYFGVDGTLLDKQGDLSANAQDDETFVINAYIEDGVVDNQTTLINFTPQDKMSYTSDWFAMFYREMVSYVVPTESEPRVFAKFSITVPSIILLVKSGKEQFTQRITIIQRYGNTHLGNFETITDLIAEYPPTVTLDENNDVAFVYSNEVGQSNQVGFYQVEYVSLNYVWVKKDSILYNLSTKQFNFLGLTVNVGFSNPRGVPTVAQSTIYQLMQELNSQSVRIQIVEDDLQIAQNDIVNLQEQVDDIVNGTTDIAFDNAGTDLNSTFVEEAIKEVNDKANANEQNIDDMKDGTDAFTEVAIGVAPNVARIRYIHTNGNNYQVLQVEYPDGRKEEINETIPVNYRNESGVSLSSGRLLMTDGTSQGNQAVKGILFDPTSPNAYKILGVVTVDGVAVNAKSKATRFGIVHNIPTSEFASSGTAYAEGQYLWGVANGRLSNVAPTKPALRVQVGIIINLQGGNADVLVAPIIYQKLSDSSDTRIGITESGAMLVNGDILRYQTSTQTWANSNALVLVEIEINNIKNGTTIVKKAEQDKNGNDIVNTYETKSVVSSVNNRVTSLENANMVKSVSYEPMTHIITFTFYDNTTQSLDLPLESAIIGASYDNVTKDITFTLQNGSTLVVPLDDLVSGLASETWVTTYFIPKTALKTSFSATPLDTNVISEKLAKDSLDLKEVLANKKSVINDSEIEYPNSKAVLDIGLDTKISALKNKTLREIFITNNLLSNSNFINTENWAVRPNTSQGVTNGINTITATNTYGTVGIQQTFTPVNGNSVYIVLKAKSDNVSTLLVYRGASLEFVNIGSVFEVKSILATLTTDNSFRIMADMTNGQTYQVDYVYMIDRTSADILDISLDTLDYWFKVFRKIYEKTTPRYIIDELNSFDGSNIVKGTIPFEKTNFIEPTKNLFNKNNTISGFIDLNNGNITASSSYVTTNYYIEMKNGIAYTINTSRKVALYNTLKVIQIANSYDNPTQSLYTFTAPFDGYFRISVENIYVNDCQIEQGSSFTTYTPFGIQIPSLYVDTKDVLKDKVIVNLGDSIAQGNTGTSYKAYAHIIALEKRMKLYSKAVGGATLGDGSPDRSYIKSQYDEFKSENPTITPDYILIDGGTNDILYNTLGSIGSGYEDTWDETKTLGGLECLLENIKNDFPNTKVLFVFVHNMNTRDYASQITWYNGILSVLEKWSIPFVDIYKKGNLNTNIVAMRIYTDTGTHPTTEGYELFYVPMIKSKLYEI